MIKDLFQVCFISYTLLPLDLNFEFVLRQSISNLALIVPIHLFCISEAESCLLFITWLLLSFHIKYANLETSICMSQLGLTFKVLSFPIFLDLLFHKQKSHQRLALIYSGLYIARVTQLGSTPALVL